MIIKLIPETEQEKIKFTECQHEGVKDFFIFGSKKEEDGDNVSFHEWDGRYDFLIGSLFYHANYLSHEQFQGKIKTSATKPFLKMSNAEDGEVTEVIDADSIETEDK